MLLKYIFITGGVLSSLGKGITAASIASLLESYQLKVAVMKFDPYLNIDPGTMNPLEHGEVYVTEDGTETDLDLGHYYRFTNSPLSKDSNVTSGKIYESVLKKERKGEYLGKTVQVIPHVTDEIKERILLAAQQKTNLDFLIVEIGGTVGDIESLPFLEAIRQFRNERPQKCMNIHLTYVPFLKAAGEVKTKPTQHSVQVLREIGISPDMILCRCEKPLDQKIKEKISLFCNVSKDSVIDEPDVIRTIYEVPLQLKKQKLDQKLLQFFHLPDLSSQELKWEKICYKIANPKKEIHIGVVGKYLDHQDAYKSVIETLFHAATDHETKLHIHKLESDQIEVKPTQPLEKIFEGIDGILVPGGFGSRGFQGKIFAAQYCRTHLVPYFGICLGMQALAIEFARHILQLPDASSIEMNPETEHPIICLLEEQKQIQELGGTMRLGTYPCTIIEKSKAYQAYQKKRVHEIHRHRFEFNNQYKKKFEEKGAIFSGLWGKEKIVEIMEIKEHPWMLGVQFHPEFQSKPSCPHPLFRDFIQAALRKKYE